jgi:hypothetical protein
LKLNYLRVRYAKIILGRLEFLEILISRGQFAGGLLVSGKLSRIFLGQGWLHVSGCTVQAHEPLLNYRVDLVVMEWLSLRDHPFL